jgi:FkbM family methyltransferase
LLPIGRIGGTCRTVPACGASLQLQIDRDADNMTDRQMAALWWRQLLSELGSAADTGTPGLPGQVAKARHKAVSDLFFELLKKLPTDCLIEVGAHYAEASRKFVASKPNARAIAYEAAPEIYERAIAQKLPDRVTMYNCAVGAEPGAAKLFLPYDQDHQVWASTRKRTFGVEVKEIVVPVVSLDIAARAIVTTGAERDLAIWIDVEGAALDVLRGGEDLLKRRVALTYIEVNDLSTYEGSATSLDIIALLLKQGFIPVARDNEYHDAWNLLAVHEEAYHAARETIAAWFYTSAGSAISKTWFSDGEYSAKVRKLRFQTIFDAASGKPVAIGADGAPSLLAAADTSGRRSMLVSWKQGTKGALIALPGNRVCRADGTNGVLAADRQDIRDHETFDLIPAGADTIHMVSFWGKFVRLTPEGRVAATAESQATAASFIVKDAEPTATEIHELLGLPSLDALVG